MTDFLNGGGVFLGGSPPPVIIPNTEMDLGERGIPINYLAGDFWGRVNEVISPVLLTDRVAIGAYATLHDEKLYVAGKILSTGFNLSNTISITKDGSGNMIFTDDIAGSRTLAQLIGAGSGNVVSSGAPTNLQLAQWINSTSIQGINISSLVLEQSQITGLVSGLSGKAATIHNLVDITNHPVSGLTTGHFLKALSATSYGFTAHGLTKTDVGLSNVTNHAQVRKIVSATNNAVARWDGVSGDQIKNSVVTVGDDGSINIPFGATFNINGVNHTHAGQYQIVDNTLTALAALDTSIGFIYQTGSDLFTKYGFAGSGSANTVSRSDHDHSGIYITGNQSITLSGDITGSGAITIATTLATVNTNVYGTNTFLKFTVNEKGLVTAAEAVAEADIQVVFGSKTANFVYAAPNGAAGNATFRLLVADDIPTIAQSKVTGLVSDLSGKQAADNKLTTYAALATSTGYLYNNGSGVLSWAIPGGGGNVSNSGTPTSGQLAQWVSANAIQGIAITSLATDGFGALTDVTTNNATVSAHGFLPKLGGGTTNFLRADGTWAAPGAAAPLDGIWDWATDKYAPYAAKQTTLQHFYLGTTAPDQTTRLNFDGYLYATQLYDNGTRVLTTIPADVVRTGQVNTYGDFAQTFTDNIIRINNPADTFYYTLTAGAIAANRVLNLPVITGSDTIAVLGLAQTFTAAKTFSSSSLLLNNPAGTFAYTFVGAAIAAARSITLPLLTGNDIMVTEAFTQTLINKTISAASNTLTGVARTDAANTYGDFNNIFRSSRLIMSNPGNTFNYTFVGSAIAAARSITLPLLTGDDTMATIAFAQTLTNKTLNTTDNTITATSQALGDLLKNDGSKFVRFAKGSGLQVLRTNTGATDLEWVTPPWSVISPAALTSVDDTNVTITLGGTPSTALLQAASITLGWTGTLADNRIASAATWNAKQAGSANLTSVSGLTYVSTSFVKMTSANTFTLDTSTYLTGNQSITLSGDISGTGTTAITTAIGANKVTLAMMAQMATSSFLGRVTASTGNVEVLTATQATSLLNQFTTTLKGVVPASGGGTTNFLRADGSWASPGAGVWVTDTYGIKLATDANNVGIGGASPYGFKLQVYGATYMTGSLAVAGTIDTPSGVRVAPNDNVEGYVGFYSTTSSRRWEVGKDNITEASGDVGANFRIRRYSNTNTLLGTAVEIIRSTGDIALNGIVSVSGALLSRAVVNGTWSASAVMHSRLISFQGTDSLNADPFADTSGEGQKNIHIGTFSSGAYGGGNRFSVLITGSERFTIQGYGANVGFVGISTNNPRVKLNVCAALVEAPTLGTASGTILVGESSNGYGMLMGVGGSGKGWIQVQRVDSTATAYNLVLQPSGGGVDFGGKFGWDTNDAFTWDGASVAHYGLSKTGTGYVALSGYYGLAFITQSSLRTFITPSGSMDHYGTININGTNVNAHISPDAYGMAITTTGASGGGWARSYRFRQKNDGTLLAGFGGYGGENTLENLWIGREYNDACAIFQPDGEVQLFHNNVVKLQVQAAGVLIHSGLRLNTTGAAAGKVWTSSDADGNGSWQTAGGGGSELTLTEAPAANQTATGVKVVMTAGEALSFGQVVYFKSDGKVWKSLSGTASTTPVIGMAISSAAANGSVTVLLHGIVRNDNWAWSVGTKLYLEIYSGDMIQAPPTGSGHTVQVLGVATHADRVYFNPSMDTLVNV